MNHLKGMYHESRDVSLFKGRAILFLCIRPYMDQTLTIMHAIKCSMDLDLALRIEQPPSPTNSSSSKEKKFYEMWERSNHMSLMIIKHNILETFRGVVSKEGTNAKQFLAEIKKCFSKSYKEEINILLHSLTSMRYNGKGNIREYIMKISHTVSKLKTLKTQLSEDVLVHLVLNSLSAHFNQFKISYNYENKKWSLNELISFCL